MSTRLGKMTEEEALARGLPKGAHTYRGIVGGHYDMGGALQFNILTLALGLREHHYLLDIGCGSLRSGRLFIPYLQPGHYYCIEPEMWKVNEGFENELGNEIWYVKYPVFSDNEDFELSTFHYAPDYLQFDYLLAASIFTHASVAQISKCLSEAKKVMKPESIFVATYLEDTTEWVGDEWNPAPRFYKQETMRGLINAQGLSGHFLDNVRRFEPPEWPEAVTHKWILIVHPEHEAIEDCIERFK